MSEPLLIYCDIGDGARYAILNPKSFEDGGLEWRLRYNDPSKVRFQAATIVEQYAHMCDPNVSEADAINLLRHMRRAYKAALEREPE